MKQVILVNSKDNVVTAVSEILENTTISINDQTITVKQSISFGHKAIASRIILITGIFFRKPAKIAEKERSLCTIIKFGLNLLISISIGKKLKNWLILKYLMRVFNFFEGAFKIGLIFFTENFFVRISVALEAITKMLNSGFFLNSRIIA